MKKLLVVLTVTCLIATGAAGQDKMNKKMENKSDKMNKKMENGSDKMVKKIDTGMSKLDRKADTASKSTRSRVRKVTSK